jgi:prolyl-tRNA editing enzyme YbaK/EbsC (Cys-tRNA(Pro) deacylase)
MNELSTSASRVQRALDGYGLSLQVVELPDSTRAAADAAAAIGTTVAQIAKSLIFRTVETGRPVLVIASGVNRVNERRVGELMEEAIVKADADFVRTQTGFAIGGVPPVGHDRPIETFVDEDLLQYAEIWAAAGTPNAVFRLKQTDLKMIFTNMFYCIKQK